MSSSNLSLKEIINCIARVAERRYDASQITGLLVTLKEKALKLHQKELAAHICCLQEAAAVHSSYFLAFSLLKKCAFYDAWCELENTEKSLWSIKPSKKYLPDYWEDFWILGKFDFIEEHVAKWQKLFPYKLFISPGMTYKEYCSVCDKEINPRKPCGHNDGEIYDGEMRARVIRDIRYDHLAIVENPAHKFAVLFLVDPETGERVDQYDYTLVEDLASVLTNPFQSWNYKVQQIERDYAYFKKRGYEEQDLCPCGSEKEYSDCCISSTVTVPHFQFTYATQPRTNPEF